MISDYIIAAVWFGPDVRMRVWKKLATQISNRMSLEDALMRLLEHARENNSPLADIYSQILKTYRKGTPFGQTLKGYASQEEILLIFSAQSSARLTEGLKLAARVLEARSVMRKSLYANLTAPCLYLLACIAMLILISVQVVPQLTMVSDPEGWTGATRLMYLVASFISSWAGIMCGLFLLFALAAIFLSFRLWTGRLRRLADRVIPWSIYRMTVGTVWLFTIATRMQAGHQLSLILQDMVRDASPYMREIVQAVLRHSRHGEDFGRSLQDSGMNFPSREIVDDLLIYSRMPGFQSHIMDIADVWIVQGQENVARYAQIIGVCVQVLVIAQLALVAIVGSTFQDQIQTGGF